MVVKVVSGDEMCYKVTEEQFKLLKELESDYMIESVSELEFRDLASLAETKARKPKTFEDCYDE